MPDASDAVTEGIRCLALVKDPASLAALLTQSGATLAGPWLGPLPPCVFAQVLQHVFHGPVPLRIRMQTAARLARVCKTWKPAVEAAAFSLLQFDVQDRDVLAHFDPRHGNWRGGLQHVQGVKLEKADSSAAVLASMAASLLRDLPIRIPDLGGTARPSSPSLGPEQVKRVASVLAECPKMEYFDADTAAAAVLPHLTARYKHLTRVWPRLRAIAMTWTHSLDDLFAVLQKVSQLETLESVKLSVYPPVATSDGHRVSGKANARVQALPRLKELSVKASSGVKGLWDAAAMLIRPTRNWRWSRCKSIANLELSNLRADTDLGKVLLPQLTRLGGTPVRLLKIDIEPCSLFLGASEPMPSASKLLDKVPATIHVVDATCAAYGQPASFAFDDRLAAILARPVSHSLAVADDGTFVPTTGEQPPGQIVAMHTDGPLPFLKFFVRFADLASQFIISEWSRADLPDLAGL
ncbi:hypothetical protein BMF94_3962 [Rhodotorula taiwanensis]|uniref:F-box domain-containing protein n=1 Tax=Rhodotorula taiwanensis TaxID=741276 RepID=A0A2S5B877_9BASI|nr:hypothetical protein BMF94_3962 [Rhodotorula taiwanensis]